MNDILPFFPLIEPRRKQINACKFIQQQIEAGKTDIVIAAPTGAGKSAIGVCAGFWMASHLPPPGVSRGAYYLVTQKMLQDQITDDIPRYQAQCQNCASIKTSEEYPCPEYQNCGAGARVSASANRLAELPAEKKALLSVDTIAKKSKKCSCLAAGSCSYRIAKDRWHNAALSVTNYAYFFTSKLYTNDLKPRQLLILDECHTLEEQIIRFVDGAVSLSQLKKWTTLKELPKLDNIRQYATWIEKEYVPALQAAYQELLDLELLQPDGEASKDVVELDKVICKLNRAVETLRHDEQNWVFWREDSRDGSDSQYIARPVFGAPYTKEFVHALAPVRLYLSAYPGIAGVFVRNLGLDPAKVAWATMSSEFPVERRRVHVYPTGSMGSARKHETLPLLLKMAVKIADKHQTRGLIHSNSYEIGSRIREALIEAGHGDRVIFPQNADARETAFKEHADKESSILISPSMQEGFDFAGDKARWQIIAKLPYPFLGCKQTARKLELDEEWYTMRTVMTLIQACGRICRSATDFGVTYVLDADFERLWKKAAYMMPEWYKEAVVFH